MFNQQRVARQLVQPQSRTFLRMVYQVMKGRATTHQEVAEELKQAKIEYIDE